MTHDVRPTAVNIMSRLLYAVNRLSLVITLSAILRTMEKKVILVILDGWGIGHNDETNPVYMVQPPTFAALKDTYPVTSLQASGIGVGLPWGEVGNSEVGHLTLGAGKVLYQYYPKITMAIQDGSFFENEVLKTSAPMPARTIPQSTSSACFQRGMFTPRLTT